MMVLKILGANGLRKTPFDNQYLKSYNPDTEYGTVDLSATHNLDEALKFDGPEEVLLFLKQVSDVEPIRPDGKPNRPITGMYIQILSLEKAKEGL